MNNREQELEHDLAQWTSLIESEKKIFERRLRAKSQTSDPNEQAEWDVLIHESDKALKRLSRGKLLAEVRISRFKSGYTD